MSQLWHRKYPLSFEELRPPGASLEKVDIIMLQTKAPPGSGPTTDDSHNSLTDAAPSDTPTPDVHFGDADLHDPIILDDGGFTVPATPARTFVKPGVLGGASAKPRFGGLGRP